MGESIGFETDVQPGYARFVYSRLYSKESFLRLFSDALDIAVANGRVAALIDVREMTGPIPDTMERFEIAEAAAEIQLGKSNLVSVVVLGKTPWVDENRFGETVFLNRAAVGRVFTNEADAITWLEHAVSRP